MDWEIWIHNKTNKMIKKAVSLLYMEWERGHITLTIRVKEVPDEWQKKHIFSSPVSISLSLSSFPILSLSLSLSLPLSLSLSLSLSPVISGSTVLI